jgi:hypothetical protein
MIVATITGFAQNVGINTSAPQATLDVKGGQRVGGAGHYTTYDSVSGKIVWKNSNLFVNAAQYLMKHSASSEGLYYGNSQLEYRYSDGTPRFYTNWSTGNGFFAGSLGIGNATPNFPLSFSGAAGDKISLWSNSGSSYGFGVQSYLLQIHTDVPEADIAFGSGSSASFTETMRIKGNGNLGIGTNNPGARLHVYNGASGYSGSYFTGMILEGSGNTYSNIVTPNANESGLLFGNAGNLAAGGIVYNNSLTANGLQFRTNGNATKMVIDQAGNVGIGWTAPNTPLTFPPYVGQKITLYPGATGNVGFAVQANLLQIYSDNPFADIAFGYDQAGTLTERFRFKANGAFAVNGNTGTAGQVLKSTGSASSPTWGTVPNALFDNTAQVNQTSKVSATTAAKIAVPGMGKTDYTLTVTANSKLLINTWVHGVTTTCDRCGATNFWVTTSIYKNGNPVAYANVDADGNSGNGSHASLNTGMAVIDVGPGTYTFETNSGVYDGPAISIERGRMFVMLIPQ